MKLAEYRRAAGLTQQQLANLALVSRAAVSAVENGYYRPTARFAGKVCRALSVSLSARVDTWEVFPSSFSGIRTGSGIRVGA